MDFTTQSDDKNTQKIKEETAAIKNDIKDLIERLANLKDYSKEILQGSLKDLMSTIKSLGGKIEVNRGVEELCTSTRNHPMRNLSYAFVAGAIVTLFYCRKNNK